MKRCVIGFAVALIAMGGTVFGEGFLGFRLLDLDGKKVKWGTGDGPVVVSYAFVDKTVTFPNARNCAGMVPLDALLEASGISRSVLEQEVRAAFAMWEQVANIDFRPAGTPSEAGILIGAQELPIGRAFANVDYRPGPGATREIERSLICLNPSRSWKVGFGGNIAAYDLRYTIAHEIGHAIGLDHPEPDGQLMSFKYQEAFRTPQAGDVQGAVRLYGTRRTLAPAAATGQQVTNATSPRG